MPTMSSIIGCQSLTSILAIVYQLVGCVVLILTGTRPTVASDRLLREVEEGECLLLKAQTETAAGSATRQTDVQASSRRAIDLNRDSEEPLTDKPQKSEQLIISPIHAFELLPSTLWSDIVDDDDLLGDLSTWDNTTLYVSSHPIEKPTELSFKTHTRTTEVQAAQPLAVPHLCVVAPDDDAICDNFSSQPPTQCHSFWYTELLTVPGQRVYTFWELTEADDEDDSSSGFEVDEEHHAINTSSQLTDVHQHTSPHPTTSNFTSIRWSDLEDGLPEIDELEAILAGTLLSRDNDCPEALHLSSHKRDLSWSEYVRDTNSLSPIMEQVEYDQDDQTSSYGSVISSRRWGDYSGDEALPDLDDDWISDITSVTSSSA